MLVRQRKEVQAMPRFTTIQLTGLDDTRRIHRQNHVHVYGLRVEDAARRLVGVAVNIQDARDIMDMAKYNQAMPQIEVDDRRWFYVAVLGAETLFDESKDPQA